MSRLIADGYDTLGVRYRDWAASIDADPRDSWLARLDAVLAPGCRVLDLGCGPGVPTARRLAERFDVTGVDISERQIEAAREAVPSGRFIIADMTDIEFSPASFDAVVALYSLIHVPNEALPALLHRIHSWLAPEGLFLATFGTIDSEGVQPDWLGVPMFFAGHGPAANRTLLKEAGFGLLEDEVVTSIEPGEGKVSFHWLFTRKAE